MPDQDYASTLTSLGFQPVQPIDQKLRFGLETIYSAEPSLRIENAFEQEAGDVRLVIATISYRPSSGQNSRSVRETIAYFEAPDLRFADFRLQPKGVTGSLLGSMFSMVGFQPVHVPGRDEFNETYLVISMSPDSTRRLLTDDVVDAIMTRRDLAVRSSGPRLVISRSRTVLPADAIKDFVYTAQSVMAPMTSAVRDAMASGDWAPRKEAFDNATQVGGLAGHLLSGTFVKPEIVEQFLEQSPPRVVPPEIMRRQVGYGSIFFYIWGGMFFVIGSIFVIVFANSEELPGWGVLLLGLIPLMGLTAIVLTWRYRAARKRLLRQGLLCRAHVEDVQPTSVYINNQRRYKVRMRIERDGSEVEKKINAYGPEVETARMHIDNGEPTRILVDPQNENRILWIDSLMPAIERPRQST
ncbi:hypothetical protein Mal4_58270 [Maioricimonas rarisocia]|uniref:Uncharacterized protein n=1 Tax=Maioricimonas rarisocia TaxID=2528026 RepID=A0A517ZG93_9PLAN|nr:hemolysin III family protein [Maioricimonas rarisocia]QDU41459.1 hypothetical protein Mal4_58270 [Maioricimonas rarisocia]